MLWSAPSLWEGAECWIVAGGPSVPREFGIPEETIKKVMRREEPPSVYSPYLESIHNKHIIGINNAYQIGRDWIDVLFFGDCSWYLLHRHAIAKFPGLKVTCCPRFEGKNKHKSDGIKYLGKDPDHRHGVTRNKERVAWNHNSGAASISMAVHFGVKRIILLGFDMNLDTDNVSHWHGSHGNLNEKIKQPTFKRHMKGFPKIAAEAKTMGVEILNCSHNSSIDVFPKVTVKDLI